MAARYIRLARVLLKRREKDVHHQRGRGSYEFPTRPLFFTRLIGLRLVYAIRSTARNVSMRDACTAMNSSAAR